MGDYLGVLEESPQDRNKNLVDRVERMLSQMKSRLPRPPQFLLYIFRERKNIDLYVDCVILVLINDPIFYFFMLLN